MSSNHLESLILKFLEGTISEKETAILKEWLHKSEYRKTFEAYIKQHFELQLLLQDSDKAKDYSNILASIQKGQATRKQPVIAFVLRYAAIFAGITVGALFAYYQLIDPKKHQSAQESKVTLQLQDGSIKVLEEGASGSIITAEGQKVVQQQKNVLLYADTVPHIAGPEIMAYNELTVPYGKKFELKLSDGTHVYLNSGSSLKYPVRFLVDGNREVFLDGEAYFEVEKNDGNPFVVNAQGFNTVVLGTKFNVSSYKNEYNTSTVLVEGAVRVEGNGKATEIRPGERATFENGNIAVDRVNVEKHIAWTKGQLYFVDDSFALILKELERHFDMEVQGNHKDLDSIPFTGTFETETLEDILTTFQLHSDFSYKVSENGKIVFINQLQ